MAAQVNEICRHVSILNSNIRTNSIRNLFSLLISSRHVTRYVCVCICELVSVCVCWRNVVIPVCVCACLSVGLFLGNCKRTTLGFSLAKEEMGRAKHSWVERGVGWGVEASDPNVITAESWFWRITSGQQSRNILMNLERPPASPALRYILFFFSGTFIEFEGRKFIFLFIWDRDFFFFTFSVASLLALLASPFSRAHSTPAMGRHWFYVRIWSHVHRLISF